MKQTFEITGMTCSVCSSAIERFLSRQSGINSVQVSLTAKTMDVDFDDNLISGQDIINAVKSLGYGAYFYGELPSDKTVDETAKLKTRFIISLCILLPLIYVSMAHMLALPLPDFLNSHQNPQINAIAQGVLALAIIIINFTYFTRGISSCFKGVANMDTLIALGSGVSFIYSLTLTIISFFNKAVLVHALHFESSAMILTLVTLGKWLEEKSKAKTGKEIEKLLKLAPDEVVVERDGQPLTISSKQLKVGDVIIIKQGEYVVADGEIVFGNSFVDKSAITGESLPVEVSVGDKVTSAALNVGNVIKVRAEKVGADTTLSKIIKMVRDAGSSKAPIQRFADKVAGIFVPTVCLLSLLTFCVWLLIDGKFNPDHCITYAISVLVISCPCALGLATPVAIMSATGKGASLGILYKDASAIQRACQVNAVLLDKTATLTYGKPQLVDAIFVDQAEENKGGYVKNQTLDLSAITNPSHIKLIKIASGIERNSNHPLAKCITDFSPEFLPVENFEYTVGKGATAVFDGDTYKIGNKSHVSKCKLSPKLAEFAQLHEKDGKTVLFMSQNASVVALLVVADVLKPNAKETIALLKQRSMRIAMLTGDAMLTAKSVAKTLEIDEYLAGALPQDKLTAVQNVQKVGGVVAMVGDGINDSPALKTSDLAIAMGNGTDVAIDCADVIITGDNVATLDTVFDLAKRAIKTIKQNLFWAFFYNVIAIPVSAGAFAFAGITLTPAIASACMSLSSLFVVTNALRLFGYKNKRVLAIEKGDIYVNSPAPNSSAGPEPDQTQTDQNSNPQSNETSNKEQTMKKIITINGMCCQHCAGRVVKEISVLPNVISAEVKLKKNVAIIRSRTPVDDELVSKAITDAGYTVEKIENK